MPVASVVACANTAPDASFETTGTPAVIEPSLFFTSTVNDVGGAPPPPPAPPPPAASPPPALVPTSVDEPECEDDVCVVDVCVELDVVVVVVASPPDPPVPAVVSPPSEGVDDPHAASPAARAAAQIT
jgi:hypothetical protein